MSSRLMPRYKKKKIQYARSSSYAGIITSGNDSPVSATKSVSRLSPMFANALRG